MHPFLFDDLPSRSLNRVNRLKVVTLLALLSVPLECLVGWCESLEREALIMSHIK